MAFSQIGRKLLEGLATSLNGMRIDSINYVWSEFQPSFNVHSTLASAMRCALNKSCHSAVDTTSELCIIIENRCFPPGHTLASFISTTACAVLSDSPVGWTCCCCCSCWCVQSLRKSITLNYSAEIPSIPSESDGQTDKHWFAVVGLQSIIGRQRCSWLSRWPTPSVWFWTSETRRKCPQRLQDPGGHLCWMHMARLEWRSARLCAAVASCTGGIQNGKCELPRAPDTDDDFVNRDVRE